MFDHNGYVALLYNNAAKYVQLVNLPNDFQHPVSQAESLADNRRQTLTGQGFQIARSYSTGRVGQRPVCTPEQAKGSLLDRAYQ